MVVGDPKQIEPVFTVPIKLIEALAVHAHLPGDRELAPHLTSVQVLADGANALGTPVQFEGKRQWIGSPLRVHRRCVEPMFSIANQIAYNNKMVFSDPKNPAARSPPADSLNVGDSAWVQLHGAADSKQAVAAQISLVFEALVALVGSTGSLPPLYIVSPFKRIKDELLERISRPENWPSLTVRGANARLKKDLDKWCRAHIGTVHTFQGKEQSIVWLVLGCDHQTESAAQWAADKPNILNVALTRAKHRFFMIGDAALWGKQKYFAVACQALPLISADEFMHRVGHAPLLTKDAAGTNISVPAALPLEEKGRLP